MPDVALKPNSNDIKSFISYITQDWHGLGGNPMIEIRSISNMRKVNVARFSLDWIDDAVQHIEAMNAAKQNIYMVINPVNGDVVIEPGRGAKDTDIMAAFFCFADADTDGSMRNVLSFAGPKFTASVKTGATPYMRGHAYWQLEEPCQNLDAWRTVQASIAAILGTDSTVINPSRIMRVAGTVSWPNEDKQSRGYINEYVTMRTEFSTDRDPVPFDRMMRAFPASAIKQASSMSSGLSNENGEPANFIDTGKQAMDRALAEARITSGEHWHDNIIRLVASYVGKGLSDSEIHALTDRFTQPPYSVDDTRREVQQAISGARQKGWAPEPQMTPQEALIKIETSAPMAAKTDQPQPQAQAARPRKPIFWANEARPVLDSSYMVKGWLGQKQMSVIYGPSNVGKSFFCLDLAYCIAANREWQGCKVNGGTVLYLAAEGGNAYRNRVYALHTSYEGDAVPLAVRASPVDLLHPEADMPELGALCKEIEETHGKLALIVIDTLSRAMAGGNENGPEDMTAFIANIDALRDYTGAHTMIVHHTGKDAAQGARGHSSLRAATDTEIELEVSGQIRTATATKQRDMEPAKPFAFKLKVHELGKDPDDDAVTTCTIEKASDDDMQDARQQRPKGRNQIALLEAFRQMRDDGIGRANPNGTGFPEYGRYWMIDEKDFADFARGKLSGSNVRAAFQKALEGLISSGYMTQNDGYLWISAKEGRV